MGNDEEDDKLNEREFEKQIAELESNIEHEKETEKPEMMGITVNRDFLLNAVGILYISMIVFEWILLIVMIQVISYPINYAMSTPGGLHAAGACFLILSFALNLQFQTSKKSAASGKMSYFLGLIGAIFILTSAFQSLNIFDYFNYLTITVIIITFSLMLLGCLQFSQIVYRKFL